MVSAFLLREKRSEERQTAMQIKTVNRAQDRQSWQGKLEDEQMAIYVENARHFAQGGAPVFHVAQTEGDRRAIERRIRERQPHGIGHDGFAQSFSVRDGQHFFGKIEARDLRGAVSPIKISAATEQMVGEIVAAGN